MDFKPPRSCFECLLQKKEKKILQKNENPKILPVGLSFQNLVDENFQSSKERPDIFLYFWEMVIFPFPSGSWIRLKKLEILIFFEKTETTGK